MSEQTPNPAQNPTEEPFIPPQYMIYVSIASLLVAVYVVLTQSTQSVIFWGALGLAVLSFGAWALMAPDRFKALLTGRTVRFGGTTLLVTIVFLVALMALYSVVKAQKWRADLSQRDNYTLTDQSRQLIAAIGSDPNVKPIKILAFYDATRAGQRDQQSVLFDDYQRSSAGKITYEFINPDEDPVRAGQFSAANGDLFVAQVKDDGQPDPENAQKVSIVQSFEEDLTNAILRTAAYGDYRAYFLKTDDGLAITAGGGMTRLNDVMTKRFGWKTQSVSFFELTSPESKINLTDPAADGSVLVIPGGSKPLTDEQVKFLGDYLDKGGKLILLASPSLDPAVPALAVSDNLSQMLYDKMGIRFVNEFALDQTQSADQSGLIPVATDFSRTLYITSILTAQTPMVFELPYRIELSSSAPQNVTVNWLARTTSSGYSKPVADVINNNIAKSSDNVGGPLILAASAENTQTGARLVLFGSTSIMSDTWIVSGVGNIDAAYRSLEWTSGYNSNQFGRVPITPRAQDNPIFADSGTISNINFIVVILLPFGILGIGLLVWWNSRERGEAARAR